MKNNNLIKLNELKKYETNPFIFELKGKMYLQPRANTIIAKGKALMDTETGEILDDSVLIGRRRMVDKSEFAKVYSSEIGKLYDLSKPAQKVFLYLMSKMEYNTKTYFNYWADHKKLGYSGKSTPLLGIKELINHNIIAPAIMPHYYWMNPTIVCKGERFAVYTEYVNGDINAESAYKKQIHEKYENLPEEIQKKLEYAKEQKADIDSEKKYQQLSIFPDENPYKKENQ